eukprot:1645657-Prymnesium_polylepis.1
MAAIRSCNRARTILFTPCCSSCDGPARLLLGFFGTKKRGISASDGSCSSSDRSRSRQMRATSSLVACSADRRANSRARCSRRAQPLGPGAVVVRAISVTACACWVTAKARAAHRSPPPCARTAWWSAAARAPTRTGRRPPCAR